MDLKKYAQKSWFYPLVVLLVMLLAYGTQIVRLGFYWDDWQALFLSKLGSASAYWEYYFSDRPFSAWTYILSVPLLGTSPLPWQLFTLLLRWSSVIAFCWALSGIWPQRIRQIRWIGILLALYPGFTQQAVSVAYSQHFISYALFTLSLGLMVWALRKPEHYFLFTALALLTALLELATMEYFFGLELLRPYILWIMLQSRREKKTGIFKEWLKHWAPYLVVLIIFASWRFFLYPRLLAGEDENQVLFLGSLMSSPVSALLQMGQRILQDGIHLFLFVWANTILPATIELNARAALFSWFLGLAAAVILVWYDRASRPTASDQIPYEDDFYRQAALLGLLGILLGGLPVWITERQVIVGMWSDRFALAPMLGAVVLVVVLVDWFIQDRQRSAILLAVLAGLSISVNIRNTNKYRLNWDIQRDYYWQMVWRAPALQPGTAVLGPKYPFGLVADYSVAYAFNILYADKFDVKNTPYWFLAGPWDIAKDDPALLTGIPIKDQLRNVAFNSSTLNSLGVGFKPGRGCLLVLDSVYQLAPQITPEEATLFPISHPQQILATSGIEFSPSMQIFGKEPPHNWCYFFQKADLARQNGDWQGIIDLAQQAEQLGLKPAYSPELLPFIEAYVHLGNWEQAVAATIQANQLTAESQPFLCAAWDRFKDQPGASPALLNAHQQIQQTLLCNNPGAE